MNTGEAEPSSGPNGRLRPRKSNNPSPKTAKNTRKPDAKQALDKPKRTSTPSKASSNKPYDLNAKAGSTETQNLCPYCDKTFVADQALSKHVHRLHLPNSKQDSRITCLFCTHVEKDANDIIRHMVDNHPNQYFACYDCHTRFPSTTELAEHKLNVCEKQKIPYRNKLRQKETPKKGINLNGRNDFGDDIKDFTNEHGFNGIVISCELKSAHGHDLADIEDNITTNFILPPGKNLVNGTVIEKNAVIILDELQWSKRVPPNFSFQNTDADQILSRLGVVHRSPRTGESHSREWLKNNDESHQKFEKCFDTSFYSKVASNVQENLTKFLDGSCNSNPDPENTIKTRKAKNIVAINTVEGFPILLACEQFSRNGFDGYMPRAIAPKHKWKWDNLENEKSLMSPEHIKRDSHTNNCIISLVSSLDIWTQLCMRRKFEIIFNKTPVQKKTERKSIIAKELKEILESRELPPPSSQVVKYTGPPAPSRSSAEFPASLGLVPTTPSFDLKPAVLSGEWVRPRCYVCCACGAQTHDSKALSSHISMRHPNAQIQHYEIVGEVLLNSDILKHLYVPPRQMNNRTRPLRGLRECTKCKNSISLEDLHQHMLDCAGDTPAVRRKCRYRPFGVRKRRPRLPDNTIRKDIRTRHSRKSHMRPRPRRKTEVGDAETIRKMLADLPAKRHRVMVKPLNPSIRSRGNLKSLRNKLVMKKKRIIEETKKSQDVNSAQVNTVSVGAEGSKRNLNDPNNRPHVRTFKNTVKRVASKILRKTKNILSKSKRKTSQQNGNTVNVLSAVQIPLTDSGKDSIQVDQLSIENNSERINLNDGSNNNREQGDRSNNNSNNRDRQIPEADNGQGNNLRDNFAPLQNAPLKHSIASLTASSETHDKSVQFHRLFLIQQECYDVNQHLPAEQRLKMLFENEAVVTKLDKPPLHFNNRRPLDLQALQKNKLNKPRKALHDCIAMLKNKLVEPNTSIPGHVSVQCGDDEPLAPEPMIVERRHSTTELKTDYAHVSNYCHALVPNKAVEDNVQSVTSKSRTTQRSSSIRHEHSPRSNKAAELLYCNKLMQLRQYIYESQMLAAQNFSERESRRSNSLVSTDELLLQHAMNLELLSKSNELMRFTDYHHYPNVSTHQQPIKNYRNDTQKNIATNNVQPTKSKATQNGSTQGKNVPDLGSINAKQSHCNTSNINFIPTKGNNDKHHTKSVQLSNTAATIDKVIDTYPQKAVAEDISASLNVEKIILPVNKSPQEHHSQNVPRNTCNNDISPVQYIINNNVEAEHSSGPLDLSNKLLGKEDSVQYRTQKQRSVTASDTYQTLDLSNKNVGNLIARDTNKNSDDIADMRKYTPLPSELVNNEVLEENVTETSFRRDEDIPTSLSGSQRQSSIPTPSFENTTEGHRRLPLRYLRNLSHPIRHADGRCFMAPECYDPNTQTNIVVEEEMLADLPEIRSVNKLNMSVMEEPMHLYTNNAEPNDENVRTDLSRKSGSIHGMVESTRALNNNVSNFDTQQAPHSMNNDRIINCHYDRQIRTPSEKKFTRLSNESPIIYCDRIEHFEANTAVGTVSRGISINESSINKSDYTRSDMPLSIKLDEGVYNSSRKSNDYEKMTTTAYTLANDFISVTKTDPTYTSATMTTHATLSVNTNKETLNETTSSETEIVKLTETFNPLSSSDNKISVLKNLSVSNTFTSTSISSMESDKRKVETVIVSNNNSANLDQDHETARKIAMLPKELVEILGTMPVDHRNQLLNVLPQYVSTSTSPVSNSNTDEGVRCISSSSSGSLVTNTNTSDQVGQEFKFESNSEDERMNNTRPTSSKNYKFPESPPISVPSSALLTPPTPKFSEPYALQSPLTEDQTPLKRVDINELNVDSNMLAVKKFTNPIEYNDPHKVIVSTADENSSGNADLTNIESVIHTHMVTVFNKDISPTEAISKSKVLKTSNDKTASLRAVRIKTPSERHRSLLAENKLVEKQNKNPLSIHVQDETSKDSDNISPMAIQQAEVSSNERRPVLNTSHTKYSKEEKKNEEKVIIKKNDEKALTLPDSFNLVKSTLSKEMKVNPNDGCPTVVCEDNSMKNPVNSENMSSLIRANSVNDINIGIETIHNIFTKENVTKKQLSSGTPNESSMIEDDDSEDDVSLAVIVKQKQRYSNSNSDPNNINRNKKTIKENTKSVELIYDKSSFEAKLECNKNTPTDTISEITTHKDRECNESNLIETNGKKNAKKCRRLNIAQTVVFSNRKDLTFATDGYENEINKENNVSSDISKNTESSEDSFKLKPIDQDPNRSSSVNEICYSDNKNIDSPNPSGNNDKGKKTIEINTECGHSIDEIVETNQNEIPNPKQNDSECNFPQSSFYSSSIEQSLPQTHRGTESEIILGNADVSENSNEIIKCKSSNLEDFNKSENLKDLVSGEKSVKSKTVSIECCPATYVNPATHDNSELEETNGTLLRRSKRGKSLYIDSNSTMDDNPGVRDNNSVQRPPLTKKQLIFSKLLLDEAKNNKILSNNTLKLGEEYLNKTSLNSIPRIDDIRSLNTVKENPHTTSLNTIPNIVEENLHTTSLNSMPNIVEENFDKTSLSTMPHVIEENVHKTLLNTKSQIIEENLQKSPLNTMPNITEENHHQTSLNTVPHIAKDNPHEKSLNTIPNIVDDNLNKPFNKISNQDKKNIISNYISSKQEYQSEAQPKLSSVCNVIVHKESIEKIHVNKRKVHKESIEKIHVNKRNIPPQSKRKSKKKKSMSNQANSKDNDVELHSKINTENKVIQSENSNKETLSHDDTVSEILSLNDKELVKQDVSYVNVDCVGKSTDIGHNNSSSKLVSIEKRKSCSPPSHDFLPSSKPKKSKVNDDSEKAVAVSISKINEKRNIVEIKTAESNGTVTTRITTCYNKPARRARSKSVVVKSSGSEFYDPYDIDLEDMADKTEPFVRKEIHAKINFSPFKSIAAKTRKLSKTAPSAIIDISPTESSEQVPSTSVNKEACLRNNDTIESHYNTKIDCNENALRIKYGSSDSDESTKSDEPLQKYAEKKEKTLAELSLTIGRNKICSENINDSNEKSRDKSKSRKTDSLSIFINKKEETIANDSEKDRRSEQFMESFGFFSERKPRKSNLLATKKISETFHSIANESDDVYFTTKERSVKKGSTDNRKEENRYSKGSSCSPSKRREAARAGRKKKSGTPIESRFCTVCKKSFRRSDNFLRHQMTLYHVSRLCEVELKVKSVIIEEEPNYLIAYRQQLEKLKFLQDKIVKRKKNSLPTYDIILPTLQEIIADVKRTIREQQLSRRKLSRDEALFLDCCEMLKQSHKKVLPENNRVRVQCNNFNCPQTCEDQLALEKCNLGAKCEIKSDEDMDSLTAKTILESDEVRNLENDLISNLKEASGMKGFASLRIKSSDELTKNASQATATASSYHQDVNFDEIEASVTSKNLRREVKDKMYPDINDTIDMFEDKFDKIKRKCRSQAAAAKQIQIQVDPNLSNKTRKKFDRKKVKKSCKKSQNVVPTKGALKGFDGIKVSISTSDINMSAIAPAIGSSFKKKKSNTKKKKERKSSDVSSKSESDHVTNESSKKKVDVYEFLDTEDTELFEFRPSTLMERFKSFNKDLPSTSKVHANELADTSTDSVSDGDDFVYMDDLVFSEEETENSVLSCELGCVKGNNESKKSPPLKKKDVIEKNAVMGKIFKHNAVRGDKKNTKQFAKPKANLDQLFDSLLEKEPKEQLKGIEDPSKETTSSASTYCRISPQRKETVQSKYLDLPPVVLSRKPEPSMSVTPFEQIISQRNAATYKYESSKQYTQSHQVLKFDTSFNKYRKGDVTENDGYKWKYRVSLPTRDVDYTFTEHKSNEKLLAEKLSSTKRNSNEAIEAAFRVESPEEEISYEDAGVARQRARRKCTVGKQNVLAETWSSESEQDAAPRPNSAESVVATHARKRKARKREARETSTARKVARPRGPSARARLACWSEGEAEPEHPQQHGWIVGDSHKKLVTMLAHAKGRKRSHDDQQELE